MGAEDTPTQLKNDYPGINPSKPNDAIGRGNSCINYSYMLHNVIFII